MNLRKKALSLMLIAMMIFAAGCGSNSNNASSASAESESSQQQALDLQGSWVAEVQGSDYYLAGFIEGDLIELHWVSSYDQNGSVYWAGTYLAPKDQPETYTWESVRDEAIMSTSAYCSVDASRSFTYADGKLTLAGSATGAETVLIPSETDYTYLAVNMDEAYDNDASEQKTVTEDPAATEEPAVDAIQAAADEKTKDVKVVNTGYSVESLGGGNSLIYYAAEIKNPNKYNAIVSPNIEITVLDSEGRVLTKQNRSLLAIAPGDSFCFGDAINCPKGTPDKVEITVENNDYDFKAFEGSGLHSVKDFEVGEVSEERSGDQYTFNGTVTNKSAEDLGGVVASIVFKRDGEIVGGVSGQIGTVVAGDTASFSIAAKSGFSDYDSYDVYVTQEPV